ncbi:3-oxoacyl-[acyl-carrier protein] reductase [Sphingobium faniae]|nr:3-oxoacyl-[acyl-carrier protein] reductase [Sphingobium faniae]
MSGQLAGRTALVVGAAGGRGSAVVRRFLAEGARVIGTSSSGSLPDLGDSGHGPEMLALNLADPASVERLPAQLAERGAIPDIVVNNAGISTHRAKVHEVPLEEWQRLMTVNLQGAFLLMKHCIPLMLAHGGGSYINMASITAYRATAGTGVYCATKGGVLQLTRAAALDYVEDNIRVNAVCPGTVYTDMLRAQPADFVEMLETRVPAGRLAWPDEVAGLVLFLASDDSRYITGQGYIIDGGRSAG